MDKSKRTILVAGATGKQGGAVLHHLRRRGFPVRAITRDPDKPAARVLAGDELSMTQMAGMFGRVLSREMRYQQIPWDEFEKQAGPEMTSMFRWFNEVGYHADIPALRQAYAELTTLERWLRGNAWGTS